MTVDTKQAVRDIVCDHPAAVGVFELLESIIVAAALLSGRGLQAG